MSVATSAPMLSLFDGRALLGFILARGKSGWEAFDADQRTLGIYPTQRDAADAISANAIEGAQHA
jgi:hypothetical protein